MSQNQVHENHEMSHALYEDLAALKIRIAFAEISEAELDEYDRELSSVSESDYSEAAQKRALKMIERKLNKQLSKRFIRKTLPHTIQVIAITLLLFFIGLTTAVATVRPVRLRILDFIAKIEETHSTISLANDIDYIVVPPEWKGKYYPFYIPESFRFSHIDDFFNSVYYIAADNRTLEFGEFNNADYSSVNIDEESVLEITINGSTGIVTTGKSGTKITWCIDSTYLYLFFSGNFDEAKRIAESVRLINSLKL